MTDSTATLPSQSDGYEVTRFNALTHGILSRYTVLPWEDAGEYEILLNALIAEHAPQGPTEAHLVEELTGILWRKRRLRQAEAAAHQRSLDKTLAPDRDTVKAALAHLDADKPIERVVDAIRATPEDTLRDLKALDEDESTTTKALDILRTNKKDAYDKALAALPADTREWWGERLSQDPDDLDEDEEPVMQDAACLKRFLEEEVLACHTQRRKELANRPLISAQAFGETLDPDELERLGRYEVHLDRKLERTLSMLFRLKELRREVAPE